MSQVWSASHVLGAKQNSQGECVYHQYLRRKARGHDPLEQELQANSELRA